MEIAGFTEEQQIAADSINGVFTIIAAAGSGKTTVLTSRHANMVMSGIPADEILNLTFTSGAAKEMSQRSGVMGADRNFRTFHSFCMELLDKEREYLPFQLCSTVIPVEMQDYQLLFDLVKIYRGIKDWETLKEKISEWKRAGVSPDQALEQTQHLKTQYFLALAFRDYESRQRESGWLDFDSVIAETLNLLKTNDGVRERWSKKYLAVDECQDTDILQAEIVRLLSKGNVYCVGDFNQTIFEWRGAAPNSLTDLVRQMPGHKVLYLSRNFRSTVRLVEFFKAILPVHNGLETKMFTMNEEGIDPTFTEYLDEDEEIEQILKKAATDPLNSAILARTNRQLFQYQKLCALRGIKYKFLGKRDFWEQPEVKKLLDFAKKSTSAQPANEVLEQLIRDHRLKEIYARSSRPMEKAPIENLNDIVKMAAGKGTMPEFLKWLRKVTYGRQNAKGLTLATCHMAKGLQFNKVFLIGANQGTMPHSDGEISEEARLFYVACTRSAKELHISYFKNLSEFIPEPYRNTVIEFEPEYV